MQTEIILYQRRRDILKAIKLNIKRIKCDNRDYRDNSARLEDYESYLNKPCPWCGANLLTQKDFNTIKRLIAVANFLNWILRPFLKYDKNAVGIRIVGEINGTGKIMFKLPKKEVE